MSAHAAQPRASAGVPLSRYLPLALLVTVAVTAVPLALVTLLGPARGAPAVGLHVLAAVAISVAMARAVAALWTRYGRSSSDLVFGDLLLWGWARRALAERRLEQASQELLGGAADQGDGASLLRRLSALLEARDPYTHGHSRRVARHSERVAREMGLPRDEVTRIRSAALVHDIGKINTPRAILTKPGRLTDAEFELVKRHPGDGAAMVAELGDPELAAIVRHHHERLDGAGYPDGLRRPRHPARRAHHRRGRHLRRDHLDARPTAGRARTSRRSTCSRARPTGSSTRTRSPRSRATTRAAHDRLGGGCSPPRRSGSCRASGACTGARGQRGADRAGCLRRGRRRADRRLHRGRRCPRLLTRRRRPGADGRRRQAERQPGAPPAPRPAASEHAHRWRDAPRRRARLRPRTRPGRGSDRRPWCLLVTSTRRARSTRPPPRSTDGGRLERWRRSARRARGPRRAIAGARSRRAAGAGHRARCCPTWRRPQPTPRLGLP